MSATLTLLFQGVLGIALFFFVTTHFSILVARHFALGGERSRHIYWIYRQPLLIRLTDRQFIANAILLFQYRRLTRRVLGPACDICRGKKVLQVSCAFGDFTRALASCCSRLGEVYVFDLVHAELSNVRRKLEHAREARACSLFQGDAVAMPLPDAAFDHVVSFFLFHELPPAHKRRVFAECLRVLKPGGTFMYGEFHRPETWLGRFWANFVFTVFEPFAREMWTWDPLRELDPEQWTTRRERLLGGYFQVTFVQRREA